MGSTRRVIVLGSTGSIGTQTLEVIDHLNGLHATGAWGTRYELVGLAAGKNLCDLAEQRGTYDVKHAAIMEMPDPTVHNRGFRVGQHAAEQLVRDVECDVVVAAISGVAGLPATLAAAELGRDIALANKETLVAAGSLIVPMARKSGSRILPVDSEHSGVWQCLGDRKYAPPLSLGHEISRVVLTASGGPFRSWTRERIQRATVQEALNHPTWNMGKKVTIDSASLMNKALEIIEAHWLFGVPGTRIKALIHPQSIVHAMVEFADGSVVTQLGAPDMRTPIQHALTWPERAPGCSKKIENLSRLDFEEPDVERFPALTLAYRAIAEGGSSGAVMNAANEAAVSAFLEGRIGFGAITELTHQAMETVPWREIETLADVLEVDALARAVVNSR